MPTFQQSIFYPKHPEKYKGKTYPFARSSWERSFMEYFDNNPQIIEWASEPLAIPYIKPTDGKVHRYIPDFIVVYRDTSGNTRVELLEIKPYAQTRQSRSKKPMVRLAETTTWAINTAKWLAAQEWCKQRNITFRILTEKGDMTSKWTKQTVKVLGEANSESHTQ